LSIRELEESIERLKSEMNEFSPYYRVRQPFATKTSVYPKEEVDKSVVLAVSNLLGKYGAFIGRAKAIFPSYADKLEKIDEGVSDQFSELYDVENWRNYFSILSVGIQKISEVMIYVKELESVVSEETVPKSLYDQAVGEIESQKKVIDILAKSRGLPLLNDLIQKSKASGIGIDENWAVTICAVNLIEAAVNKKLEDFGESTKEEFNRRLDRLTKIIEEKEGRNIQTLIPRALKTVRDKLDHASHKYKPVSFETTTFVEQALSFLENLFPSEDKQGV